ncbi:hypothetical protein N7520_005523 [Penicillium odoratum]|uniref:uncharacterized protein n=1 Tax=Penicillium odoratum TaxID=1167516 RepID=UPI00254903D9|nr:uncharacterized protein N7520_005523 [Penicillium odoratum]KAJ5758367.1 hypothetical protein N7520_005523 [Penicillium odoratum]
MEVFDRKELSAKVEDLPSGTTCFFHDETMVFMGDIGCGRFGLICVVPDDPTVTSKLGWADDTDPKRLKLLKEHFKEWNPMVRNVLDLSKDMGVFPTGGAFGAGCSFAFEDAKTLTLALKHVHRETGRWSAGALKRALELYDNTRSPHIFKIFEVLESADGPEEQSAHVKMEGVKQMKWLTNIDTEEEFYRTLSRKILPSYQREGLLPANEIISMFSPRGSVTTG